MVVVVATAVLAGVAAVGGAIYWLLLHVFSAETLAIPAYCFGGLALCFIALLAVAFRGANK